MQNATMAAIGALIQADAPRNDEERRRLAELCGTLGPGVPLPRILRHRQAAEVLGVSRRTLSNFVRRGVLREFRPHGAARALGFRDSDLRAFLTGATPATTSPAE